MKSYVITIKELPESVKSAERMIASAPEYDIQMFDAIVPSDNPKQILAHNNIPVSWFKEKGSYIDNCIAAFLSHWTLWQMCVRDGEEYQIFEHDAVAVAPIPRHINYQGCINLGAPSYGAQKQCTILGVNPLTTKQYFPGAHAYRLKPRAAESLVEMAYEYAQPTDIFLNLSFFPWLEEFYPHPVEAKDTFTTIQKVGGCTAKHNYGEAYEIIEF